VLDGDGVLSAAVPVEITLLTPRGEITVHRATSLGRLDVALPLAEDMRPLSGVRVRELFSGKAVDIAIGD